MPLLKLTGVSKHFATSKSFFAGKSPTVRALDDITLEIESGQTLGLVGESGSGKTTLGRVVVRLLEATAGSIFFDGQELTSLSSLHMRALRRDIQIIFQDPYASLDPRMTIGQIIAEPLQIHRLAHGQALRDRVCELLELVGLQADHVGRYPHEFSGGQRQRVGIARAIAVNPRFIVADEPVSALDVSIQAQVMNLLEDLQTRLGLTYLFIAHDLAIVRHIATRVAVMYLGRICEWADRDSLYTSPRHPYTQALLSAIPIPDPRPEVRRKRIFLTGEIPSPVNPPSGCRFHTRCPIAYDRCKVQMPELIAYGTHQVACHWVEEHHGLAPSLF